MITSERVRLRAIEKEDLPQIVVWLNDPEVKQNLDLYLPLSMAQEDIWFEKMLAQPAEEHPLIIEINTPEGWRMVGNTSFSNINWRNRSAEIGIFIGDKSCWNQGYGRDVMRLMLKHGFTAINLHRVFLRVYEINKRGIRSYEHAGFKHEGCMRDAQFQEGRYVDVLLMSVLSSEWEESEES